MTQQYGFGHSFRLKAGFKLSAGLIALACGMAVLAMPAQAQDGNQDSRLRKVEAEISALQRQVFPGGDTRYFPGQSGQGAAAAPNPGPSTTAVTDLLTRMDAVEAQNARLTAQVEELSNRMRLLEARPAAVPATPPVAGPVAGPPAPVQGSETDVPQPAVTEAAPVTPRPAPTRPVVVATPAKPSAQRVAAVKAIVKPQTGDAGEDEYSYGFKLWEAKFYPEAAQQLKMYLEKYPRHKSVSLARNLLGRAYLDDGKPAEAAPWFLQNYKGDRNGKRAPDSLLFLAQSMVDMKDTNRACVALAEFADSYKAEAAGRLKQQYADTRSRVTCN